MSWDPTVLELHNVQEGFFLNQSIYPTVFAAYPDNDAGNVGVVCALLGQPRSSCANGNGTLATVTFYVEDEGCTTLHLYNTMLLDYDIVELPHETEDGYFCAHAPVGGEATPIYIPMNNPETPTLLIWLSIIMLSLALTVVYVKKRKRDTDTCMHQIFNAS